MNHPIQTTLQAVVLILLMAFNSLALAAPPSKDSDPVVRSASPNSAVQGDQKMIVISGANFAPGASVRFLVTDTKDSSQINVLSAVYEDESTLTVEIQVLDTAAVSNYDIEVRVGSRKGKGTTFRVESSTVSPSECNFDFDAELCDKRVYMGGKWGGKCTECEYIHLETGNCVATAADCKGLGATKCTMTLQAGLRSDTQEPYPAIGGMGFRLDTNGSMKLETARDDRKIVVDFDVHSLCPDEENPNPDHPATAAGFCMKMKGSDIRIEHQVQDPYGLCVLEEGESVPQGVVVSFQADDGGTLIDPNRNGNGPEPLRLNYGCRGNQTGVEHYVPEWRAMVTRRSEWEWSIVGTTACLETQLGEIWADSGEPPEPIEIQMPFRIDIMRVDAPKP